MNKRGFLQACLAASTAPFVITSSGLLMPVRTLVRPSNISLIEQLMEIPMIAGSILSPRYYKWFAAIAVASAQESGYSVVMDPDILRLLEQTRITNE